MKHREKIKLPKLSKKIKVNLKIIILIFLIMLSIYLIIKYMSNCERFANELVYEKKSTCPKGEIEIPDKFKSIAEEAFSGCNEITLVTLPDNIISIGKKAFYKCEKLKSVNNLENSKIIIIEDASFDRCYLLENITIPDLVERIGNYAFNWCRSLKSIDIPDSVTSIGNYAFKECRSLKSIIIPDSVTTIGKELFYGCKSLTSIIIGDSVTWTIDSTFQRSGDYAFRECRALTTITIGNSVTTIGMQAFKNCGKLENVIFKKESQLTTISMLAFDGCKSLVSITIPDSVTTIGKWAFERCIKLENVIMSKSTFNAIRWQRKSLYSSNPRPPFIYILDKNETYEKFQKYLYVDGPFSDENRRTLQGQSYLEKIKKKEEEAAAKKKEEAAAEAAIKKEEEMFAKYTKIPGNYCAPGSIASPWSNIGSYKVFKDRASSQIDCDNTNGCVGFTYRKRDKKYILKNKITGTVKNNAYDCYSKKYAEIDGYYCYPGSFTKSSNIDGYKVFKDRESAQKDCDVRHNCRGFTYRKRDKKYILKKKITGKVKNGGYICYKKGI